ncbi:MAG: nitrous oxide reductase accessory protein NosL [Campylobacterales bacterium]|nr:nitrous oxide reductase accessory protein NosL [Campylobacterales bacterium]
MRLLIVWCMVLGLLFAAQAKDLSGKHFDALHLKPDLMCPIKAVPVEAYEKWLGYIQYNDNSVQAVSSPKYAFNFFHTEALKHFAGIYKLYMTDFKTGKLIDASEAYYVFGSRVMSVGGDDIIPFAEEADAQDFLEANSGKKIYRFDRMDKNFINYLDMR